MRKVFNPLLVAACGAIILAVVWYSYSESQSNVAAERQAEQKALADTLEAKTLAKEEKDAFNKQRAATLTPERCGEIAPSDIAKASGDPPLTQEHEDDLRLCDDLGRLGEHHRDQLASASA
ncbi:MAG: hypothetical protein ACK4QP_17775 [Pseudorhizobium sp.]